MAKKSSSSDATEQERFIATARDLGCDESEDTFLTVMKKLAAAEPTTNQEVQRRAKIRPKT